jgi:hypothetical protein
MDNLNEITEGISYALHAATKLPDGEISLDKVAELGVEVDGTGLHVPEELLLYA